MNDYVESKFILFTFNNLIKYKNDLVGKYHKSQNKYISYVI